MASRIVGFGSFGVPYASYGTTSYGAYGQENGLEANLEAQMKEVKEMADNALLSLRVQSIGVAVLAGASVLALGVLVMRR